MHVSGGAGKSLARPTSRSCRKESIVSLARGVCSCAKLQDFSPYRGWKEACQQRDMSCHQVFFPLQGKAPKEIHAILTETLGEHAPSYATAKNWVAQVKHGDFFTCDAPHPGRSKTVTTPEITDQIHELVLEDHRISANSTAEQLGISREQAGSIIHEDSDMPPWSGSWNAWTQMQKIVPVTSGISFVRSKWLPVMTGDHGQNLVISLWPGDKATINGVAA